MPSTTPDPRLIVVAPTFDNARTLRATLDDVAMHGLPAIAVNDGSRDGTAHLLAAWADPAAGRHAVTHPHNRGKAAAMSSGFALARELGYTHALTIDTDGQHDADDLPALIAACVGAPDAIVLGVRPMGRVGYPLRSRVGRAVSNALVRVIGGVRVRDSQCGLRVYPLDVVGTLGARAGGYAFETDVLVRAGWAVVPVVEVPVRCVYDVPSGRVTHFRVWRDSLSAARMHAQLLARSLMPWPTKKFGMPGDATTSGTIFERCVRWLNPLRTWRRLRVDDAEREHLALAAGVGLFIGTQPAFGLKTILCLLAARLLKLQPLAVIAASSLSTPPIGFAMWTASIAVGHVLLHGEWPAVATYDFRSRGAADVLRTVAGEWMVGAVVVGAALGLAMWCLIRLLMRRTMR